MPQQHPFMQSFAQLPDTLPIFPLSNAVLLPRSQLPLNIFEQRYLNMISDAMKSHQLIGMIQPKGTQHTGSLYDVGCAGRITRYAETGDGRIELQLIGLCRFKVHNELTSVRGYRLIMPDWSDYAGDMQLEQTLPEENVSSFKSALQAYLSRNNITTDWQALEKFSAEELVNNLFSFLPLNAEDKQMLVETESRASLLTGFTALLNNSTNDLKITH